MTHHACLSAFRNGLTLSMADAPMGALAMLPPNAFSNGDKQPRLTANFFPIEKHDLNIVSVRRVSFHAFSSLFQRAVIITKNKPSKNRGIIYSRINRIEKEKLNTLLDRIRCCQKQMKMDMVEEAHFFITDVPSGLNYKKPGLAKLMKFAEDRSIDYLYVYDLSGLGRNLFKTIGLLNKLESYGVTVKTATVERRSPNTRNEESQLKGVI